MKPMNMQASSQEEPRHLLPLLDSKDEPTTTNKQIKVGILLLSMYSKYLHEATSKELDGLTNACTDRVSDCPNVAAGVAAVFCQLSFWRESLDTPPKNSFLFVPNLCCIAFGRLVQCGEEDIITTPPSSVSACITVFLVLLSLPSTIGSIGQK